MKKFIKRLLFENNVVQVTILTIIVMLIMILTMVVAKSYGEGLCDFTNGMTFVEKGVASQVIVDLTPLLRVSGYSAQNPETKEFNLEALVIPPKNYNEYMEKGLSAIEGTIRELKEHGEKGKIALPAFKIVSKVNNERGEEIIITEGFNLLTNAIVLITNETITTETLCQIVESLTPGCVIEQTTGKNAFEITMSLECAINSFELVTALSGRDEIKFCAPLFIRCGPDGEVLGEENPAPKPLKKALPKFNI